LSFSAAAYLLALGLSLRGGLDGLVVTLAPGIAAVLYSEPCLPITDVDRLKDVAGLNTAIVAAAWAIPLTYLPVAIGGGSAGVTAMVVGLFIFLRTFAGVEVMNVRDVVGDRAVGVGTLPVRFGVRPTRMVLYAIDAVTVTLLLVAASLNLLSPVMAGVLAAVIPYSVLITTLLGTDLDRTRLGTAKDGEYILMAAGAFVVLSL
jgi:4-hydroxybenzoate polyprenyltransferase